MQNQIILLNFILRFTRYIFFLSGEGKNLVAIVEINQQLESESEYADPSDTIKRSYESDKPDLDIGYVYFFLKLPTIHVHF